MRELNEGMSSRLRLSAALSLALLAAGCGGGQRAAADPAERDCLAEWNGPANEQNRAVVAAAGDYAVASATEWVMQASGDGDASYGCGYLFHTETVHVSFSGIWRDEQLEWGVPPTLKGTWSAEQQRNTIDNALVLEDGRLADLARATASWGERACKSAGRAASVSYELCFRGGRGAHGSLIADADAARRVVTIRPPPAASRRAPLIGHWEWAAVSPDGRTLLAQWSVECEVPFAFLVPLADGGEPVLATGGRPWYEQPPSEALGWSTDGRPLIRVWKVGCGREAGRGTVHAVTDGALTALPCLARLERTAESRDVARACDEEPAIFATACNRKDAEPPCGRGAQRGVAYAFTLWTHCGITHALFDGRFWLAEPPLDDGSHNPPRGWDNPAQQGSMRLLSPQSAEFRAGAGLVARFRPAPATYEPRPCA